MPQITVMTGPERRRRWSAEEQRRIVEAALAPGAVVADVARQYDVCTSLIYKWRRDACRPGAGEAFVPAVIVEGALDPAGGSGPAIMVELPRGVRVTIGAHASAALVGAALKALR